MDEVDSFSVFAAFLFEESGTLISLSLSFSLFNFSLEILSSLLRSWFFLFKLVVFFLLEDFISITSSSDSVGVCSSTFCWVFFGKFLEVEVFCSTSVAFDLEVFPPFLIFFNDSSTFLGSLFSVKVFILLDAEVKLAAFFYSNF